MSRTNTINKDDVLHVAKLARLSLTEEEVELYSGQLAQIVDYVNKLQEIDTTNVEPTFQVIDGTTNVFRKDEVTGGFSQNEALSQAKRTHKGFFVADDVFSENSSDNALKPKFSDWKPIDKYNAVLTEVDSKGTVGHKDLFMTKGIVTTAGSRVLEGYTAHYSSTIALELEKYGYRTRYKLNQDAWGHGSSGENSDYGASLNPWDMSRVPGGSSSGSGIAVATGEVEVATGTDTCGSIRMPSGFMNLSGIKSSYGALSRFGVIAFASSLDCPGFIARDVKTLRKFFNLTFKPDPKDATSQSIFRENKTGKIRKIGVVKEFMGEGLDSEISVIIEEAKKIFEKIGYSFVEISLPHAMYGIAAYYLIAPTETSSNLSRYDGVRYGNSRQFFGPEAKRRIMLGTFASSAGYSSKYYEKAARVRTLIIEDFNKAYSQVDAILAPVSPIPAFKLGEKTNNPIQMYLTDIFAAPASLAGLPSLSIPCGFTKTGLPVGMQLIGRRFSEKSLFDTGEEFQEITDFHKKTYDSK